jgi:oxygen-independent coproporphyrinogen-3 oxidase
MTNAWEIYDQRVRSASLARRTLPYVKVHDEDRTKVFDNLVNNETVITDRVIYIHIPFCKSVCSFCMYTKQIISDETIITKYFNTIIRQIQSLAGTPYIKSAPFKAIYFGGGTPTSVPVQFPVSIIYELKKNFLLTQDCEITVESTISEINATCLSELINAGVNRISLGVQTFDNEIRKSLGRVSDNEQISEKIKEIKEGGINNICIDLIYNLEGQDSVKWERDLSFPGTLPLTGCSVYPLITNPNNPGFNESLEKDNIFKEYHYFLQAEARLLSIPGWISFTPVQYGNSETGRGVYVSSHGQSPDLLAFGTGAGGRIGNAQYLITDDMNKYLKGDGIFRNQSSVLMTIDKAYLKFRNIFLLSECLLIKNSDYQLLEEYFFDIISDLENKGLLLFKNDAINLTESGKFWAGNISALFAARIKQLIDK